MMKDRGQHKKKERQSLPSEKVSWPKEGLYISVSILILFVIHILITIILLALFGN